MYKLLIALGLISIATLANASEEKEHAIKLEFGTNIQTNLKSTGYVRRTNSPINFGFGISKKIDDIHLGLSTYHNNLKSEGIKNNTLYRQDFNIHALFAYLEHDIYRGETLTPFWTLGGGIAYNKADAYIGFGQANGVHAGKKILSRAYNIGAGIKINIDDTHRIMVGYKYYDLGTAKTSSQAFTAKKATSTESIKTKLNHHSIFIALMLHF